MRAPFLLLLLLAACGPDVSAWKGTWTGTAVVNTGRQPEPYPGTLTVSDGARFEGVATSGGTAFSCALTAATADGAKVTFAANSTCALTANPPDGCTRAVTVTQGSATRTDNALEGSLSGRVETTCTGPGSGATDFLLTVSATR